MKKILTFFLFSIIFITNTNNSFSIEPDVFIQSTVNRAADTLSSNLSKEERIEELKQIARDTVGSLANIVGGDPWYNITVANNTEHFSEFDYWSTRVASGVDFRAKNIDSFDNLEKNSMDFYASVRSLYLQDRQMKISNSNTIIETMDDSDWEEIETK